MTGKERIIAVMRHEIPDRIPAVPDISNMIPARLTGKPFWDIYLYQDPPLWVAYIDAVKKLGIDGFLDYQIPLVFPDEIPEKSQEWQTAVVQRTEDRIVTRDYRSVSGNMEWSETCSVYPADNPPTFNLSPEKIGLSEIPLEWYPLEGVREWPVGPEAFYEAYERMGDSGVVGACCGTSSVVYGEEGIFAYYDDPDSVREYSKRVLESSMKRFDHIMEMDPKPDYIGCGASGSLVFQTVDIFRDVSLPIVKAVTKRCAEAGIPSHIHSCGPETQLVKICAQETDLDIIDPLEIPPMGDCDLFQLKQLYGSKLALKGNLHTTSVMLRGSYKDVYEESRKVIEIAKAGGEFILSTGDQCGRDTPLENIQAMIDACNDFGRY